MNNGKPAEVTSNPNIQCVSLDPAEPKANTCSITLFYNFLKLIFMKIILKNM